jgi:hypothetical protein
MDSFQRPYWSKLEVELWVCTRRREAVGLAEYAPGRTRFADLSLGPDGIDDEKYDVDAPPFVDGDELILWAISRYGSVCPLDEARKAILVALSADSDEAGRGFRPEAGRRVKRLATLTPDRRPILTPRQVVPVVHRRGPRRE